MTVTLQLPGDLETSLSAEAARRGLPLADHILRILSAAAEDATMPRNGAELVAYWQREGLAGSRPDIVDSQEHTRRIRAAGERRTGG